MKIITKTTQQTNPIITLLFIVFFSLLGIGNASAQNQEKPYVVKKTIDATNKIYDLNFYFDNEKNSHSEGEIIDISDDTPTWIKDDEKINSVTIDNTFNSYTPTSCANWFQGVAKFNGLSYLNTSECKSMEGMFMNCTANYITDIEKLKTDAVITMKDMFKDCSNLTALYFDNFNTEKVKDMSGMFSGCTNLSSIDADKLNSAIVTDMSSMFEGCNNFSPFDILDLLANPNFTTQKVTNMSNMFKDCATTSIFNTTLEFKYFNTELVTDFSGMFEDCTFIDILDIHTFSSASAQNMSKMFKNCSNLKTIHVLSDWDPEQLSEDQRIDMYDGCDKLPTDNPLNKYGEIYVTLDGTTLTFHYDLNKLNYSTTYAPIAATSDPNDPIIPEWLSINPSVTKVVFLEEFKDARPTHCAYWFQGCSQLTEIEGLNYLNLYNVDDLSHMFENCSNLKVIDIRSFKTDQVSYMYYMFSGCKSLKTILISDKWSTEGLGSKLWDEPTESQMHSSSSEMFLNCTELIGDDGTCADPECVNSTTRDYKGNYQFQYAHANKGGYMTKDYVKVFNYLDEFEELNPKTLKKETIKQWKKYDNIIVDYENGTITLPTITPTPFYWHGDKLYGWAITNNLNTPDTIKIKESEETTTITFDKFNLNNGHFDIKAVFLHPYAEFDNATGTLTFKYDTKISHKTVEEDKNNNKHLIFDVIYYNGSGAVGNPEWASFRNSEIKTVTFDKSFKEYHLEEFVSTGDGTHYCGCKGWFRNCDKLTNVDFTNFDASHVTDMSNMFENCTQLTQITNLNTENVKTMESMFYNCTSLINVTFDSYFSTKNVEYMNGMFNKCTNLQSIDLSSFDTKNVRSFSDMFYQCQKLASLDLRSFETDKLTNMYRMFGDCEALTEILFDKEKFNTSNINNFSQLFERCSSLTTLDISGFDTKNVEEMGFMFNECSSLETLDLSNFDTQNVNDFSNMFLDCSKLTTIIVGDDWTTTQAKVNNTHSINTEIFNGCTKLIGGSNIPYNAKNIGINYANAKTGYLTKLPYTIKYKDADTKKELSTDLLSNGTYPDSYSSTDAKITIKPPTNKKGYVFKGWTDGLNGNTGLTTLTNEDITLDPANIKYNLVFNANWEKITYTVTFIDGTYSSSTTVDDNSTISEFPQREKEGYTLTWTIKENSTSTPFQLSTPITDNITLYAEWAVKQYTVSFENKFGEKPASQTVKYGSTITEPDTKNFIDDDNTFTGLWYTTDDFSGVAWNFATSSVFNNTTLYAKWEPIPVWTVRFINNSSTYSSAQVKDGNLVTPPSTNPSKTGHTFKSWCIYNNDGELTEYVFEQNRVDKSFDLYASFEPNQHTITYLIDDIVIDKPLTVYYGEKIAIKEVPQDKEGFNFSGWTPSSLPETMPDQDIEVNGYWLAKGQYLLTFDTDGGTPTIASQKLYVGDPITAPSTTQLTKKGYTFKEWDTEIPAIMPDSNLTIKAIWTPNQYEVRFRIVRDTIFKTVLVPFGELITKPNENPTRKGYTFNGWIMDNIPETMDVAENGYDIIADWKPIQKISVQLQSNTNHFYYPSDSAMFCNNKESGLTLSFKYDANRPAPTHYTISFNSTEIPEQQGNVTPNADNNEILVHINIPDYALSTDYTGNIVFDDGGNSLDSNPIELVLTTNIPHKSIIMYLYHDVIFIDNNSGRYDNAKYQWYKGGNPVGQNRQYYTEPVISGIYSVKIDVNGQKPIYTCPLMASTTQIAKAALKVYPNPVRSNSEFIVEIIGYTPETEYTLLVFGNNGSLVRTTTTFESSAKLSLPQGIYNIALTANGEKCGSVKIMVER